MYKYRKWQKTITRTNNSSYAYFKNHMTLYSIKQDIDYIYFLRPDITHIANTMDTFISYRYNKDLLDFFYDTKPFFEKIKHKDRVILFDGKLCVTSSNKGQGCTLHFNHGGNRQRTIFYKM